jgi:hypothetical protein
MSGASSGIEMLNRQNQDTLPRIGAGEFLVRTDGSARQAFAQGVPSEPAPRSGSVAIGGREAPILPAAP